MQITLLQSLLFSGKGNLNIWSKETCSRVHALMLLWTREKLSLYFPCPRPVQINSNKRQQNVWTEQSEDLLYWQESWQEACIKNFARENIFVLFHSFQYLFRQVLPFVLCRNDVIHTLKISNIYTLTNSGFLSTNMLFLLHNFNRKQLHWKSNSWY